MLPLIQMFKKKVLIGPYVPLKLMEGTKQKKRGHYSKYLLDAKHPIPRTRLKITSLLVDSSIRNIILLLIQI